MSPSTPAELSPEDIQTLTHSLQQRREQLRQDLRRKLLDTGDKDYSAIAGQVHDAGDESIAELVTSLSVTIIENETREIRDIEAALGRVQDNSYGICIDCAKPIAPQRLRANPAAKRCIACQERHEDRRGGKDATPSL